MADKKQSSKNTTTTIEYNEETFVLEERTVKALDRIANVLDALTLWFEDIDKNEWGDRLAWYMHEWYTKYI
jgi:hypothetical protein